MDEQTTRMEERMAAVETRLTVVEAGEVRLTVLEKDVATVKEDVAVIRSNYVTKADLAALENKLVTQILTVSSKLEQQILALENQNLQMGVQLIKWSIATTLGFGTLAFTAGGVIFHFLR